MGTGEWDVFIAYPGPERDAAGELYAALRQGGTRVFLDHECVGLGDPWAVVLAAAQRAARVTAVLVSKRSDRAFYQREEIAQAIELWRQDPKCHRVVPIYLDEDADPPYGLRAIHGLTVASAGGMAAVARRLLPLVGREEEASMNAVGSARAMPLPSRRSPFRPGTPLYVGDLLPGASRRALVDAIAADVAAGSNVNLVGERRLGRTSLLNHVWGRLQANGRAVARVNMQDAVDGADDFFGEVLEDLGRCTLIADLLGTVPTGGTISYRELREALLQLRRHVLPVLLVDEFERCFDLPEAFPVPTFYDSLRSLLGGDEYGPYAMAVVATREPLAAYFTRCQVTSTLPSYLPARRLELLTADDAEEALAQESPHRLGPAQREHAAALAARHPCRLQCAGEAWYRALEAGADRVWVTGEFRRLSEQVCIGAV